LGAGDPDIKGVAASCLTKSRVAFAPSILTRLATDEVQVYRTSARGRGPLLAARGVCIV